MTCTLHIWQCRGLMHSLHMCTLLLQNTIQPVMRHARGCVGKAEGSSKAELPCQWRPSWTSTGCAP